MFFPMIYTTFPTVLNFICYYIFGLSIFKLKYLQFFSILTFNIFRSRFFFVNGDVMINRCLSHCWDPAPLFYPIEPPRKFIIVIRAMGYRTTTICQVPQFEHERDHPHYLLLLKGVYVCVCCEREPASLSKRADWTGRWFCVLTIISTFCWLTVLKVNVTFLSNYLFK